MNQTPAAPKTLNFILASTHYAYLLRAFFAGILVPFGFAPFHLPGLAILGIALFFAQLRLQTFKQAFFTGLVFGLGFLGLGISWIYVSIHEYGHLNAVLSAFITLVFVFYLAIYLGLVALVYNRIAIRCNALLTCFLFSSLWILGEYLRATIMGGFPWLLVGFGQIDTPLGNLLPVIGVYGVGFLACLAATFLTMSTQTSHRQRYLFIAAFVAILLTPSLLEQKSWTTTHDKQVSVGVIQANLSMRNKWDESLFWQLLDRYQRSVNKLINNKMLIVLPESAIPLPASYINDFLEAIHQKAKKAGSSVVLGIPEPSDAEHTHYYNSLITLGKAHGHYLKQHLVPFGEFSPPLFEKLLSWLAIPAANLIPGSANQPLVKVHKHPIATLICYELAYPLLLRKQLPAAEWIISISDDGWFGHSLAMYQHLQMAQVLSLQTGRYQIVANNDGLSSIINTRGTIIASLPAFTKGTLEANISPATGASPWTSFGDAPALFFSLLTVLLALIPNTAIAARLKRRYPYQPK